MFPWHSLADDRRNNNALWLWVPAFAGKAWEENMRRHPRGEFRPSFAINLVPLA